MCFLLTLDVLQTAYSLLSRSLQILPASCFCADRTAEIGYIRNIPHLCNLLVPGLLLGMKFCTLPMCRSSMLQPRYYLFSCCRPVPDANFTSNRAMCIFCNASILTLADFTTATVPLQIMRIGFTLPICSTYKTVSVRFLASISLFILRYHSCKQCSGAI